MFEPTQVLQGCVGISLVTLSFGGTWSMIQGSVVKGSIAGTTFSVNERLERVEEIEERIEDATAKIIYDPQPSKKEIEAYRQELEEINEEIDRTATELETDFEKTLELEE